MAAESNVGARLLLIGKDGVLAGIREITAATAGLNAEIAKGAKSSKVAAAGYDEQMVGLAALSGRMGVYQDNLAKSAAGTDALAKVGKVAFLTLAAAGVAWTYESIKWAQSYQTALVQLRTQAGLTVTAMNAIGAAAMKNAASLGTTPTAYLQAAYHPASTGMSTAETIAITNYAAKEAAISGAPLEDTTNSLTGVMKAYNLGASHTASTIAKLNAIVGAGNMHFSDLNSALSSGVASTAKTFGVSLTSLGGALSYLTDRGVPAAQAGTRLRMTMSLLGAPSKEASTLLQDAGMTSTAAANSTNAMAATLYAAGVQPTQLSAALSNNSGKGGIYNALELLHKHLAGAGLSQEMQAAMISRSFGGGRMGTSIEAMYNNLPGLAAKSTQITKGSTSKKFMDDWATTTKTLRFQLHQLGGELETLGTQFGKDVLPWVTKGVAGFTDFLGILDHNKALVIALGTAVTAILVPAIGLYLYRALLSSGGAIRSMIGAYTRLILGQSAEQGALARTNAVLAEQTLATDADAGAMGRLAAMGDASALGANGRIGGLANMGGGLGSKLLTAGMYAGGGVLAGSLIRGSNGTTLTNSQHGLQIVRTVGGDMIEGAGLGAAVGSIIPGVGTAIGAGVGAAAGGIYAERNQIGSAIKSGWDDLFGGGGSSSNTTPAKNRLHVQAHVYIDGKEVTSKVKQNTKRTGARK